MSSKWEFPKEIERWCCAGKSCGNTTLELISSGANTEPVLYNYVRVTNQNDYSGWKTEQEMERWLEETKDHIQEEMDLEALEKRTDLKILVGGKSGIFQLDSLQDEVRQQLNEAPESFQDKVVSQLEEKGYKVFRGAPPAGFYTSTEPLGEETANNEEMDWYASENKSEPVIDENTSDGYHTFKELYEMRLLLTAGFFGYLSLTTARVCRSKRHSDDSIPFGGGWFIVVAELPSIGQISFHYELKDWDLFSDIPEVDRPPAYDGHTSADVAYRLRQYLTKD